MAYTIIICDDNSLYGSQKEKILQREKLFNKLWFLVAPRYNGYDMSQCTVTMRYMLPISKEFKTETLVLSNEKYEEYLKYVLPFLSFLLYFPLYHGHILKDGTYYDILKNILLFQSYDYNLYFAQKLFLEK